MGVVSFEWFTEWLGSSSSLIRYHGGFLAPNIYYLGGSGVVRFNGLRIAGASGIFKSHDYSLGGYGEAKRSVYK